MTLTFIDLFAGCGGGSLGFQAAGFKALAAVEIDETAAASYRENVGIEPIVKDIRKVTGAALLQKVEVKQGELTVLFGCPPCQSFTVLRRGQRAGYTDKKRNQLPVEYLRLVRELKPRHIAFENVPGIIGPKGRYRWSQLLAALTHLEYDYVWGLLDAADYGVPQRRVRVVLVGSRVSTPRLPNPTHGTDRGLAPHRTVRSAIEYLPPVSSESIQVDDIDLLHRSRRHSSIAVQRLEALSEGQARADLPENLQLACHKDHAGHYDIYGRMWWDRPAPTLTSGCTNVTRGRFAHPEQPRAITLREALLLQTFPATSTLHGGIESASRQVGNAIPPELARAVAKSISEMDNASTAT